MADLRKTVGVMGGLGPAATLDFFAKLLAATAAERDQDHLHVIVDCDPTLPNRNEAIAGTGPSPGPGLVAMARRLEGAGAEMLVLVCNTAHAWADEIRAAVSVPFESLIEVTCDEVSRRGARRAGVLAADGCRAAGLYDEALGARGIEPIGLEAADQAEFMRLLYAIKRGDVGAAVRADMRRLGTELIRRGADVVIAGCTEVPLVLADLECPLLSSTDLLVARTVLLAGGVPLDDGVALETGGD